VYSIVYNCDDTVCAEMRPHWYKLNDIPFDSMWADDSFWFPWMLADKPFYGYFKYRGMDTIVSHEISSVVDFKSVDIPQCPFHLVN